MNISEAISKLLEVEVKQAQKVLDAFINKEYNKIPIKPGTWKEFIGYRILSQYKISIQYKTGIGDYEFNDNLVIDIKDEIRDDNLNKLLN